MNSSTHQAPDRDDQAAVAILRARGIPVTDIQSLAHDQGPFAQRTTAWTRVVVPGVNLCARPVELDGGFTNVYTLTVDLERARCHAVSSPTGFHLRDLVRHDDVAAAVSGSFSYISDDPDYQPAEPCLDLVCRDGRITGLPTATKPALLVRHERPVVRTVAATGTLTIAGHRHRWTGSKQPPSPEHEHVGHLTVYGAANCRVRYRDNARTGFLRDVDPDTNTTPRTPDALDAIVIATADGLEVTAVRSGGGVDLFASNFILRAHRPWPRHLVPGARIHVTDIDGRRAAELRSALSIGPSTADAAAGHIGAWDQSLGTSPFRPTARNARTLLAVHDNTLHLYVLDGARLTSAFQGATPHETASLCSDAGLDPSQVFHLDGGGTSKIAYNREDHGPDVVGSLNYLQWPATPDAPFRWRGLEGRVLRSAVAITALRESR